LRSFKYIQLILCIIYTLLFGCSQQQSEIDNSKKQLLEISDVDGTIMRQISDNTIIAELTLNEEVTKWEDVNEIPSAAKEIYIFTSYELITDDVFLADNENSDISIGRTILYENDGNYYVSDYSGNATYYEKIPESVGKYLIKFAEAQSDTSNIKDREELFASWRQETDLDNEASDSHAVNTTEIRVEYFNPNFSYLITSENETISFYENQQRENWIEIVEPLSMENELFEIKFYQPARKPLDNGLIENEIVHIYKDGDIYWAISIIPDNELGNDELKTYYKIPFGLVTHLDQLTK